MEWNTLVKQVHPNQEEMLDGWKAGMMNDRVKITNKTTYLEQYL